MPLYDTSIFVGHVRGNLRTRPAIEKLYDEVWSVAVSSVTVYELHLGCLIARDPLQHRATIEEYLSRVSAILPVDNVVSLGAAEIQAQLRRSNQMMDTRDLFIAATAVVHGLSICTLDLEHFRRVPDLVIEQL
jgi:tRNA(fMet)-specific endonuclease VapC